MSRVPALAGALAVLCAVAVAAGDSAAADTVPEPKTYRSAPYRGPVPATLTGATVLDTDQAHALWTAGEAVFVDVLPQPLRPANLPKNTLWRAPERRDIPGSIWLANTGYDRLSTVTEAYLMDGLADATGGDTAMALVFYCKAECWMSWNAAKRAIEAGYSTVMWYPEGTDGWAAAGLPLEPREPAPLPPQPDPPARP